MKVTFTCEKCGHVLHEMAADAFSWVSYAGSPCPNCAKLSYGPLTEEMVAEALAAAEGFHLGSYISDSTTVESWHRQARFVLRLLEAVDRAIDESGTYIPLGEEEHPRDWLLDLARKT